MLSNSLVLVFIADAPINSIIWYRIKSNALQHTHLCYTAFHATLGFAFNVTVARYTKLQFCVIVARAAIPPTLFRFCCLIYYT